MASFTQPTYHWRGGATVERYQTCHQQIMGSNRTPGKSCITTLGKLITPICLCQHYNLIPVRGGDALWLGR